MYQPELSKLSAALSRSLSAENVNGEKGKGGMDVDGVGAVCARELGQGWKISPYIVLAPGETKSIADIDGPGVIRHIWIVDNADVNRGLILRIWWDGSELPSVEVPLCDFFATAEYQEYR